MYKKFTERFAYYNFAFALIGILVALSLLLLGKTAPAQIVLIAVSLVAIIPSVRDMIKTIASGQVGIDVIALVAIGSSLVLKQYIAAGVIVIMLTGAQVRVGDSLLVKPGDMIPVDGKIYKGATSVDESAITGESLPVNMKIGDGVLSGSVNLDGAIEIHATHLSKESQYEQIIKLVSEASTKKSPLVRLADIYSLPFTIVTFVLAAIAWIISGDPVRAVSVLVVATPCPLLIATPVAIVSGMSRAASRGVIIKSGGVLEQLSRLRAVAFDKTGTVTQGKPTVSSIDPCKISKDELLKIAASVEKYSTHALAQVVVDEAKRKKVALHKVEGNKEFPGKGISAKIGKSEVLVGSFAFLKEKGVDMSSPICIGHGVQNNTALFVAKDKKYIGSITFVDPLRPEARQTVKDLSRMGVGDFIMLTGDRKQVGDRIGKELGITQVYSQVLPAQKVDILLDEKKKVSPIAMVGDGINDAPVLAASDVGVALGAKGSTAASEAADAVIMQDDLSRLSELVAISKRSVKIAKQSIFTGIGLSSILMVVAVFGFIVPVVGAFLQEAIDVVVILNALRARFRPKM